MKPCHCKTIPMRSQPTLRRFTILSTAFLHDQSLGERINDGRRASGKKLLFLEFPVFYRLVGSWLSEVEPWRSYEANRDKRDNRDKRPAISLVYRRDKRDRVL
jgi:hypothetical protein